MPEGWRVPEGWRAGLRLVLVTPGDREPRATLALLASALDGGVTAVLLRERQLPPEQGAPFVQAAVRLCREAGALALVSRDADLAREAGAHGVHVGHGGADLAACRAAAPGLLVSRSSHWPLAPDDRAADWTTLSPFFPTPDSLPRPLLDAEQVQQALATARGPVLALGGVEAGNVPGLPDGLAGVAVKRAISAAADPRAAAAALRDAVDRRWPKAHGGRLGIL
jgi:thiamine-phosphate pyrophosphorylase